VDVTVEVKKTFTFVLSETEVYGLRTALLELTREVWSKLPNGGPEKDYYGMVKELLEQTEPRGNGFYFPPETDLE